MHSVIMYNCTYTVPVPYGNVFKYFYRVIVGRKIPVPCFEKLYCSRNLNCLAVKFFFYYDFYIYSSFTFFHLLHLFIFYIYSSFTFIHLLHYLFIFYIYSSFAFPRPIPYTQGIGAGRFWGGSGSGNFLPEAGSW